MKIYRQSIWKADVTRARILPMILMMGLILLMLWGSIRFIPILIIYLIIMLLLGLLAITQCFYLILTEDKLTIKNSIIFLWKTEAPLLKITNIIIGNAGGFTSDYIQIITPTKKSMRYVIDLVGRKNYPNLVQDLQERGIKVELKGIKLD